jgi:hypothetical protein
VFCPPTSASPDTGVRQSVVPGHGSFDTNSGGLAGQLFRNLILSFDGQPFAYRKNDVDGTASNKGSLKRLVSLYTEPTRGNNFEGVLYKTLDCILVFPDFTFI